MAVEPASPISRSGGKKAQEAQKDDLPQLPEAAPPSIGVYRSARGGLSTRIYKNVALRANAAELLGFSDSQPVQRTAARLNSPVQRREIHMGSAPHLRHHRQACF